LSSVVITSAGSDSAPHTSYESVCRKRLDAAQHAQAIAPSSRYFFGNALRLGIDVSTARKPEEPEGGELDARRLLTMRGFVPPG